MIFDFSELAGNAVTISLIKRALAKGTFRQVSLFSGPRGTGKSSSANAVAMALTCESPEDGLACGRCPVCQANRKALAGSGESASVKVVNLGKMNKSEDVVKLIEDVFGLQSSGRNQVYVFEEVHALKGIKNGFNALLSEIDRMSPNTYIVMCTTNPNDVAEALRSRALEFEFKRLTAKESLALAQRLVDRKQVRVPEETLRLVTQYCRGIPREIEKLIDFVAETSVSFDEVQEFLQFVPNSTFIEVFGEMAKGSLVGAMEVLNGTLDKSSVERVVDSLKNFVIEVVFYLESGHSDVFSTQEKKEIREAFQPGEQLTAVVNIVDRVDRGSSESDLMLTFLRLNSVMQGKSPNAVVTSRATTAAREQKRAERSAEARPAVAASQRGLTALTIKSLDKF